ncbi:hypothetical protein VTJ83DRAFT_3353 [Remersonia thermophila]|uniref:Glutathione S-transferase n=1 Tax=Remersonia thermophila TaxID=72144 RepID=A0ABR4DDV6_9PEZI
MMSILISSTGFASEQCGAAGYYDGSLTKGSSMLREIPRVLRIGIGPHPQPAAQRASHLRRASLLLSISRRFTTTTTTTMAQQSPPQAQSQPNIHLYTAQTPNGIKVSMLLEELGLPYTVHAIDLTKNEQKEPWFLDDINPNGRIPALTDTFTDGSQIRLFESGSIMQYLVERYDVAHKVSYPKGTREYWEVNNWVLADGRAGTDAGKQTTLPYAPEKIQYGIDRYQNETRRLYRVMEKQLAKSTSGYLVGDRCTVADIACWGWVAASAWAGIKLDKAEFPNLVAWVDRIVARPGCNKGRHVPKRHTMLDYWSKSEDEIDRAAEEARGWIQQSMKEEARLSKV